MHVKVMKVDGFAEAVGGLRLSFNSQSDSLFFNDKIGDDYVDWSKRDITLLERIRDKKSTSESKFLRFIQVWLDVTAPRYWWQQFDTYKVGVDRLSESTMHTILAKPLGPENFENPYPPPNWIDLLNELIKTKDFDSVKSMLPESFLQRRFVIANYQSLQHIYLDRWNHKLKQWQFFCGILEQELPYFSLLISDYKLAITAKNSTDAGI